MIDGELNIMSNQGGSISISKFFCIDNKFMIKIKVKKWRLL